MRHALGTLALVAGLTLGSASCTLDGMTRSDPTAGAQLATLEDQRDASRELVRLYAAAVEANPTDMTARAKLMEAEGTLTGAEAALTEFEGELLRARFGMVTPFLNALGSIPVVGNYAVMLSPLVGALGALVPLLGKRGRRHYGNALKDLNPFAGKVAPVKAIENVARAMGAIHSSKESAKAAGDEA